MQVVANQQRRLCHNQPSCVQRKNLVANDALSQLSYSPTCVAGLIWVLGYFISVRYECHSMARRALPL